MSSAADDEETEPYVKALADRVVGAEGQRGDYVIVIHAHADDSMVYTWEWYWKPPRN